MHRVVENIRIGRRSRATDLPVIVLSAAHDGPTVVVSANVHGDEAVGAAATLALSSRMERLLKRGRLALYPSLNPIGLREQTRAFPSDNLDLNRAFPGGPAESGALAAKIFEDMVARKPSAGVDLHSDSVLSIPYAIKDRPVRLAGSERPRMEAAIDQLAEASRLTVLDEYPDDLYLRFRLDRSLAGALVNHAGIPSITLEVGPRRALDGKAVAQATDAVHRILHSQGLVDEPPKRNASPVPGGPWRRSPTPRVQAAGLFLPRLLPGALFEAGEVLGVVRALDGSVLATLQAPSRGIVISWSESAWVSAQGVPGTLGLEET